MADLLGSKQQIISQKNLVGMQEVQGGFYTVSLRTKKRLVD